MNAVINAVNVAFNAMFNNTIGIWTTSVLSGVLLVFLFAKLLGFGLRGVWAKMSYSASLILLVAVGVIYGSGTRYCLTEANNELSETKSTLARTKASNADATRCFESMIHSLNSKLDDAVNELAKTANQAKETEEELSEVRKEKDTLAERYDTLWKNVKSIENSVSNIVSDAAPNETAEQTVDFFADDEEDTESLVSRTQHEVIREQLLNSL